MVHNRLAIADDAGFLADKLNLLRLYEEALRTGLLIHPDAMRLVTANLHLIDEGLRDDREAQRIFLDLLLKHGNPDRALRRMNELGVLAAFIPEFAPIVAMMQFNMYHHYTVDEHIIQCIWHLSEIEHGTHGGAARRLEDPARGREPPGALCGAAAARHRQGPGRGPFRAGRPPCPKVAPRLGLSKTESATVEWLVRYHLLMSDMAQKRDIADPRTVRDFAKAVQTKERLDLLCVLTVCDIRGSARVSGTTGRARCCGRSTARPAARSRTGWRRSTARTAAPRPRGLCASRCPTGPPQSCAPRRGGITTYWQGLHLTAHVIFAQLLRELTDRRDPHRHPPRRRPRRDPRLLCPEGPSRHLLAARRRAGAGRRERRDARTYTTKDGFATAAFWIQDAEGTPTR